MQYAEHMTTVSFMKVRQHVSLSLPLILYEKLKTLGGSVQRERFTEHLFLLQKQKSSLIIKNFFILYD